MNIQTEACYYNYAISKMEALFCIFCSYASWEGGDLISDFFWLTEFVKLFPESLELQQRTLSHMVKLWSDRKPQACV